MRLSKGVTIIRFSKGRQRALDLNRLRCYRSYIELYLDTESEAGAVSITHWLRREYNVRADRHTMQRFMDRADD
jgi:hypothetical protein